MLDYLVNNQDFIMGDTTEKILYCCYNIGYPIENEEILQMAADIIKRYVAAILKNKPSLAHRSLYVPETLTS